MKDYIRKRVLDISNHILESKHTVRQTATVFGVSKSTVHKDIPKVNGERTARVDHREPGATCREWEPA